MTDSNPPQPSGPTPGPSYGYGPQPDEIDLLEYLHVIWDRRIMIAASAVLVGLLAALLSLLMPDTYTAETLLAPGQEEGRQGGLGAALGGLLPVAGLFPSGDQTTLEYLAVLNSRAFLRPFIERHQLMPILFPGEWDKERGNWINPENTPTFWAAYSRFTMGGVLTTRVDKNSGLVTVAVEWTDPDQAADWARWLVADLNAFVREQEMKRVTDSLEFLNAELTRTREMEVRQSLFALMAREHNRKMLVNTRKDFAFRVLDPAEAPKGPSGPRRVLIVVVAVILGGVASVFLAVFQEGLRRRRAAPVGPRATPVSG